MTPIRAPGVGVTPIGLSPPSYAQLPTTIKQPTILGYQPPTMSNSPPTDTASPLPSILHDTLAPTIEDAS
eukprot:scaffold31461_cov69-Attheya_sp.AAC.2